LQNAFAVRQLSLVENAVRSLAFIPLGMSQRQQTQNDVPFRAGTFLTECIIREQKCFYRASIPNGIFRPPLMTYASISNWIPMILDLVKSTMYKLLCATRVEDATYISPGQAKRHPGYEDCPIGMRPIRGSLTWEMLNAVSEQFKFIRVYVITNRRFAYNSCYVGVGNEFNI
jgi:hypothetical protein